MTNKIFVTPDGQEFSTKELAMEYQELQNSEDQEFAAQRIEFLRLCEISNKAHTDIRSFRAKCEHKYVKIKAKADTGNYDRSQDSYWFEVECKCCEERWNEDQGDSKYRTDDKNVEWIK